MFFTIYLHIGFKYDKKEISSQKKSIKKYDNYPESK